MTLDRTRLHHVASQLMLDAGLSAPRAGILARALQRFDRRTVTAGERLCTAGDEANSLAIVATGRVRLVVDELSLDEVEVAAPFILGALPMVDRGERLLTCTAESPAIVLQVDQTRFQQLLAGADAESEVFRELLMASMFARLAEGTLHLRRMLGDRPLSDDEIRSPR